jgi:hypothetical protein
MTFSMNNERPKLREELHKKKEQWLLKMPLAA